MGYTYLDNDNIIPVYICSDYSDFQRKGSLAVKSEPIIGLPLLMARLGTNSHNPEDLANVVAESLSKAADGRTLRNKWHRTPGSVLVARQDKKPLYSRHLYAIITYLGYIASVVGGPQERIPTSFCTQSMFKKWWEFHHGAMKAMHGGTGGPNADDGEDSRSPFEV